MYVELYFFSVLKCIIWILSQSRIQEYIKERVNSTIKCMLSYFKESFLSFYDHVLAISSYEIVWKKTEMDEFILN